ncbi:MAG: molybdenum cofactor biosynthesis protein MoaE [Chthoniobacterales bacterium]
MAFCHVGLTTDEIVVPTLSADPAPATGARLDFLGIVRPTENGRPLAAIDYSYHPSLAGRELQRIADEAIATYPLTGLRLIHRVGRVPAGVASLFVRVDTAHRSPAYEASRWIIEQLKLRTPIWKHPIYDPVANPVAESPLAQ